MGVCFGKMITVKIENLGLAAGRGALLNIWHVPRREAFYDNTGLATTYLHRYVRKAIFIGTLKLA